MSESRNREFIAAAREAVPALLAELDAERERSEKRRKRMVAAEGDLQDIRGLLAPSGAPRRVPMELGERVAPAVEWLLARVAELEQQADAARAVHRKHDDSPHCRHDGSPWPCPTLTALGDADRDEMAESLARDGFDADEIAEILNRRTEPARVFPDRDARCATCGHSGSDHHHANARCWSNLPREREPSGTWGPIRICECREFTAGGEPR